MRKVVNIVRHSGGNFVRSEGTLLFDVGDAKAREKVGYSFRAALSSRTNNNSQQPSIAFPPKSQTKQLRCHSSEPQPMHQENVGWSPMGHEKLSLTQLTQEKNTDVFGLFACIPL